tara:strand:- start:2853 stop:3473 length:621 start_codon:yes stop_codon:yes gene_type:complete
MTKTGRIIGMLKAVPALMLIGSLSACATAPQQNLENIRETQANRQTAATRIYSQSPDQIYNAAQTVFNAMDGSDFIYDMQQDRLLASRMWTFFAVFSSGWGRQYFEVLARQEDGKTAVTLGESEESNVGMFSLPVSTRFKDHLPIGGNTTVGATIGDYNLFFDRLDYALGLSAHWPSCDNANFYRNMESGKRLVFCDLIGIDDKTP